MSKQSGYAFQHEITRSLDTLKSNKYGKQLYYQRIVDTKSYGVRCPHCRGKILPNIILPKQPADHLFIIRRRICYIEEKSTRNAISYNIKWIKPHQLEMAYEIVDAGGFYYFLLCKRVPFSMETFALTPEQLSELIMNMEKKTMIRWDKIREVASYSLKRDTKNSLWDLEPIIINVKNGGG